MDKIKKLMRKMDELITKRQGIIDKAVAESRGYSDDERTEADDLRQQITNLDEMIREAKEAEEQRAGASQSQGAILPEPGEPAPDGVRFRNLGEFVREYHNMRRGEISERMRAYSEEMRASMRAMNITEGESLGFFVPDQFESGVLRLQGTGGYVRQRARVIPAGEVPDARFMKVCLEQGAGGAYNGVEVNFVSEGVGGSDDSKLKHYLFILDPADKKIQYVYETTLEGLSNPTAISADMEMTLRGAQEELEDELFITGNGVGKPLGIMKSKALKKVKRKTSGQLNFIDVLKMSKYFYPRAIKRNWEITLDLYEQVGEMVDSSGRLIMLAGDATKGIPDILHGRPIHWNEVNPVAGQTGDVLLVDWSQYYIKDGSGPYLRTNPYTKFKQEIVQVAMTVKVDGDTWLKEPIKLKNGMVVSPFVALEE